MKRLIPKLLLKNSSFDFNQMVLVNTNKFDKVIEIGDPVSQAKIYQSQFVDELIFLDLDARKFSRPPNIKIVRAASEEIFTPFFVDSKNNSSRPDQNPPECLQEHNRSCIVSIYFLVLQNKHLPKPYSAVVCSG